MGEALSGALLRQPARKGDAHVLHMRVLQHVANTPGTTLEIAAALGSTANEVGAAVRLLRQTNKLVVVGEKPFTVSLVRKLKIFSVPKATPAKVEPRDEAPL